MMQVTPALNFFLLGALATCMIGGFGFLLGFVIRTRASLFTKLQEQSLDLAKNYVPRQDLAQTEKRLVDRLTRIETKIDAMQGGAVGR